MDVLRQVAWKVLARAMNWKSSFLGEEKGAATAEYALLLALVVVALIGTLTELGGALSEKLGDIIAEIEGGG